MTANMWIIISAAWILSFLLVYFAGRISNRAFYTVALMVIGLLIAFVILAIRQL